MGALKNYRHMSTKLAEMECRAGERQRYRVTTINWTFATVRGKQDRRLVHRNVYSFTLRGLVRFIRETGEVAEDVIAIEAEVRGGLSGIAPASGLVVYRANGRHEQNCSNEGTAQPH